MGVQLWGSYSKHGELNIAVLLAPVSHNVDNGNEDHFMVEAQISAEDLTIPKEKKALSL